MPFTIDGKSVAGNFVQGTLTIAKNKGRCDVMSFNLESCEQPRLGAEVLYEGSLGVTFKGDLERLEITEGRTSLNFECFCYGPEPEDAKPSHNDEAIGKLAAAIFLLGKER